MFKRIVFTISLLLSALFLPFYFTYLLAFGGIIYFKFFWEGLIIFFISDLLFGARIELFGEITFISTIIYSFILISVELLKKRLNVQEETYIKL